MHVIAGLKPSKNSPNADLQELISEQAVSCSAPWMSGYIYIYKYIMCLLGDYVCVDREGSVDIRYKQAGRHPDTWGKTQLDLWICLNTCNIHVVNNVKAMIYWGYI